MVSRNCLAKSTNIRATVLVTTIWAASAIGIAKDEYQKKTPETPERRSYLGREPTTDAANSTLQISERIIDFGFVFKKITNLLKSTALDWFGPVYINEKQGKHTCYRNVCFFPEYGLGLKVGGPKDPGKENPIFLFFDGPNSTGNEVNETTWETFFANFSGDISKPLIGIIHGLNGTRRSPWAVQLRSSLFENVNCNVLVVDWEERAVLPFYAKAASSAPLVGVLLSLMLQKIIQTANCSLHPDNVHLIGFSLGAHAAGVCGRHFYNTTGFLLGRITGLDPAGPLFEESNVTLSADDAEFVDVIHTNAGNISDRRFGINKSIGHVDFYPNGGHDQPGCKYDSESDDPGCSHKRAQALFIESLYTNCSFTSYYCVGGWTQFLSGSCNTSNASLIGEMGYYSINKTGRDNQYLNTSGTPPFCIPQPGTETPQIPMGESIQNTQDETEGLITLTAP